MRSLFFKWEFYLALFALGLAGCNSETGGGGSLPTVDTMPCNGGICTLNSGVVVGDAEARVVAANLAQGNVILKTQNSEVLTLLSPIQWSSRRSLTLQADNDIELFGGISASQGKLIIDNPGHDYHLRKPVNLSAGQNFRVNGDEYTVITSLGQPGSTTGTDLQGISGNLNNNYALGSNIDASATSSWNGGSGFYQITHQTDVVPFTGKLDGLGHVIRNITINRPTFSYVGLFAALDNATIQHLALEDFQITGNSAVGGLAGVIDGANRIVQSCIVGGEITAQNNSAGGFIGYLDGDLDVQDSCSLGTTIHADDKIGGMTGSNGGRQLTVSKSYVFWLEIDDVNLDSFFDAPSEAPATITVESLAQSEDIDSVPDGTTNVTFSNQKSLSTYKNVNWDISSDPDDSSLWLLDTTYARPVPAMLRIFNIDLSDYLLPSG
ncbi:hypothetical protein ABMA57_01695 [Saccharospirillum sp. HFRX-1]|uniref:hypothetical protein n=1 Tax=unclassified Saccharospirillum TaxID=2633430 RepID=UPI0037152B57